MLNEQKRKIKLPSLAELLAIEEKMHGERLELFQESMDVLHEVNRANSDPVVAWKLDNLKNLVRGFDRVNRESTRKNTRPAGLLKIEVLKQGERFDLGLAGVNMVTNNGVAYVINSILGSAVITNLKYHASGTNSTAENIADSALGTEVGSRVVGSQAVGGSSNIYSTVATLTYGSSYTIVEHGLFSASSAGTLFDRTVFAGIGVSTTISVQFTYQWTLNAGG